MEKDIFDVIVALTAAYAAVVSTIALVLEKRIADRDVPKLQIDTDIPDIVAVGEPYEKLFLKVAIVNVGRRVARLREVTAELPSKPEAPNAPWSIIWQLYDGGDENLVTLEEGESRVFRYDIEYLQAIRTEECQQYGRVIVKDSSGKPHIHKFYWLRPSERRDLKSPQGYGSEDLKSSKEKSKEK